MAVQAAMLTAVAAAVVTLIVFTLNRIDAITRSRERTALMRAVEGAATPFAGEVVQARADRFQAGGPLHADLLALARTPSASDAARFNAFLLATQLEYGLSLPTRWAIADLQWREGRLERAQLANVTIQGGTIDRLTAID